MLSSSSPVFVQVAPANTPPDTAPAAWSYLGTLNDFEIEYVDKDAAFELPAMPWSITMSVDAIHPSWDDVLAQLRTIGLPPHPACSATRGRIEDHLRSRRIAGMLQAALHGYRFPVPPVSALPQASLANPV